MPPAENCTVKKNAGIENYLLEKQATCVRYFKSSYEAKENKTIIMHTENHLTQSSFQ